MAVTVLHWFSPPPTEVRWSLPSVWLSVCNMTIKHYSDVIMSVIASQNTVVSIVCSAVCSAANQRKTSKFRLTRLCEENTLEIGGFSSQTACYAEKDSIWRHHEVWTDFHQILGQPWYTRKIANRRGCCGLLFECRTSFLFLVRESVFVCADFHGIFMVLTNLGKVFRVGLKKKDFKTRRGQGLHSLVASC